MKVAIVGLAASADLAPWDDPAWELWGLPWDAEHWHAYCRTFEMHQLSMLADYPNTDRHIERLKECRDLYMQDAYPEIPGAKRYPFEAVSATTGDDHWGSSLSYALALAIHEGAEDIGLWGVDAADEYRFQRENLLYLIGFARGRGIKVHLPESSPLCEFQSAPHFPYVGRYGWLG